MEKENISEFEYKSMEIINIKTESKGGCKICRVSVICRTILNSLILLEYFQRREKNGIIKKYQSVKVQYLK